MATVFYFVDEDGTENVSNKMPTRTLDGFWVCSEIINGKEIDLNVELPKGTIEKILGFTISWEDNPIMYIDNNR